MFNSPKTPSRHRSRSEAKTPLTPSLTAAMNGVSLASSPPKRSRAKSSSKSSTTTPFNSTNPFIAPASSRSRPTSPVKRTSGGIPVSDSFRSQAGGGVIRKGGVESRLDVVTNDYVPPPKPEIKRSKSTPAVVSHPRGSYTPILKLTPLIAESCRSRSKRSLYNPTRDDRHRRRLCHPRSALPQSPICFPRTHRPIGRSHRRTLKPPHFGVSRTTPLRVFLRYHPRSATRVCEAPLCSKAWCDCYFYRSYDE